MIRRLGRTALMAATVGCVAAAGFAGAAHAAGAKPIKVTIDDTGCPAALKAKAGANDFVVTNKGTGGVGEFEILSADATKILGEVYVDGGEKGEFSLSLKAGDYKTFCPGGTDTTFGALTVTGTADTTLTPDGQAAVDAYRTYLIEQTAILTAATKTFTAAVDSGNIEAAKAAYIPARVPYEAIEPVAESFGDLDPRIDAREGDVPAKDWGGYHLIEKALWKDGSLSTITLQVTADLNANVQTLQNLVQDVELQPAAIANGAVELLNEVSKSKITGEEERYSHVDLVDFEGNLEGAQTAYETVKPILVKKDAKLAASIDAKFAAAFATLQAYEVGGTYVLYTDLEPADTKKLSQSIDTLAEPLSKVSKQVVSQ